MWLSVESSPVTTICLTVWLKQKTLLQIILRPSVDFKGTKDFQRFWRNYYRTFRVHKEISNKSCTRCPGWEELFPLITCEIRVKHIDNKHHLDPVSTKLKLKSFTENLKSTHTQKPREGGNIWQFDSFNLKQTWNPPQFRTHKFILISLVQLICEIHKQGLTHPTPFSISLNSTFTLRNPKSPEAESRTARKLLPPDSGLAHTLTPTKQNWKSKQLFPIVTRNHAPYNPLKHLSVASVKWL